MLRSLALVLALFALLAPLEALARATRAGRDFVVDPWNTDDGLPLEHVVDVAFGPDGFVWVATFEGLVRFDGVRFTPMDDSWISAIGSRRIHRVITHPVDGALWILAERRAVGRYADGRLQVWDGLRDLGGLPLDWSIEPDGLWLWGDGGIFRLEDAPVRAPWAENHGKSDGIVSVGAATLFTAQNGAVFLADPQGEVRRLGEEDGVHGSAWFLQRTPAGLPLLQTEGGYRTWDGARFVPATVEDTRKCRILREATPPPSCPPRGAPESPWRIDGRTVTYEGREVWQLRAPPLEAILDPRGDLWIMTYGEGLIRIRPAVLRHLAVSETEPWVDRLWLDSADRLWAQGASGWGVFDPERREAAGAGIFLTPPSFGYPTELGGGRILLYHAGNRRVVHLEGDAFQVESSDESTLKGACTQLRLRDGRSLLGGDMGLLVLEGEVPVPLAVEGDLAAVRAMLELDDGKVVLGTHGGGLQVLDAELRVHSVEDGGLTVDNIRHVRRDGDTLWVSTEDEGLCAVGPVSRGLASPQWRCFLPAGAVRGVHASEVDGAGRIWLSSNVGLWVGRDDAFAAFADGGPRPELLHLGTHAGMVNAEANGPSCGTVVRDRAGVVWFPTQNGIVGADPTRFRFPAAPRVDLDAPRSGDRVLPGPPLALEPDQPVQLSWTAPAPEFADQVVFRVRVGDAPWGAPSTDRNLTLAGLPPGSFRIEVQAGLAGSWGPVASISGVRRVEWSEGPGPWVLGALLALGLGAGAVRLRTRALRRRQAALAAEVAERTAEVQAKADMLQRQTAQLAQQSARLAELEALRTRAIVNLHHELRTPLTLVMTGIERVAPPVDPKERASYDRVLRNADRLRVLMDQLADLARLEAGEVVQQARRIDLRAQIATIVGRYQGLADTRGVTLAPTPGGPPLLLWFDPDLLDKILGNIVHNALKFTPSGGSVEVRVRGGEATVRVEVDDTGPGVPEHARERVFERLFQLHREDDRPHEGSGVGLALARELTELCGGEIGVLPREGGGARFWFTLPRGTGYLLSDEIATAATAGGVLGAGDAGEIVGPAGAPLVLVVEDHADMREWLVEELSEGFRVAAAADGAQGLERASELRPALVVSDIMMPTMDGLSLARALRQREGAPPILLVSAKVSEADSASVLAAADGWLPKPFSSTALRAEVQRLTRFEVRRPEPVDVPASSASDAERRLLTRLVAAVDARLADESLSVPELARAVATSERTLHRELVRFTGMSPSRWIREHRLRRAAEMLSRGEFRTVSEVAAAVGMSRAWFTRAYRAWSGRSPGEDLPGEP